MPPRSYVFAGQHQYNPQAQLASIHSQPARHRTQQQPASAALGTRQEPFSAQAQWSAHNHLTIPPSPSGQDPPIENLSEENRRTLCYIAELNHESTREAALLELSKKREQVPELALLLWYSFGMLPCPWCVMSCLTAEIVKVYHILTPSDFTGAASNRVCNALALLQCVAAHPETRGLFIAGEFPMYLYPFLDTLSRSRPFEYLRLTSLGVIGALVKNDSPEVVKYILSTEMIPLCLRIMDTGAELSKTVAIFIIQKVLIDDYGLRYICERVDRINTVSDILCKMVDQLVTQQTARLLKHVVRCFLRLSHNNGAREVLRHGLPEPLRDGTFSGVLMDDIPTKHCLRQLLLNLADSVEPSAQTILSLAPTFNRTF